MGAMEEVPYIRSFEEIGFTNVRKIAQLDYFSGSASASTRDTAAYFGATSITIAGDKS